MRIVIMGTGGTGGYYGAALARAGHDVTFVARGAHLEAIRTNGLRITGQEEFQVNSVRAMAGLQGEPPAEVILFAVKTYDTDAGAELIRPVVGPNTMVLPIQNGVESLDRLDQLLGPGRTVGGLCRISAEIAAPGVIKLSSTFKEVILGETDGQESVRTWAFAQALRSADVPCKVTPNIRSELWQKFAFITALSGVTGAARQPIGPIRSCPEAFALFGDVVTEAVQVAVAAGVPLAPDLPGALVRFAEGLPQGMKASLLVDLERGRRTEVESLQGALSRLGRRYGVPTPTTDVLYALIKLHQPVA